MKQFLPIFILQFFSLSLLAQIGIGTDKPKATLDVELHPNYMNGESAGVAFPMMTADQIEAMITSELKAGTLVYATTISTANTPDVNDTGYWYWSGDNTKKWEPLNLGHKTVVSYFYAPSISLPTDFAGVSTNSDATIWYESSTQTFRAKLFEIYKQQFDLVGDVTGNTRTAIKSPSANKLPRVTAKELDYFVTYFDNKVFDPLTISLDDNGILSYKIISNPVISEDTFMNIIFKVK